MSDHKRQTVTMLSDDHNVYLESRQIDELDVRPSHIRLGVYSENKSFLCYGDAEPHLRSQNVIFYWKSSRWHTKVTFRGKTITGNVDGIFAEAQQNYPIRRQQLRAFTLFIKFECLPLLKDTVTEVEFGPDPVTSQRLPLSSKLSELPIENGYYQFTNNLHYQIREDPSRIRYPPFVRDSSVPTTELAEVGQIAEVASGISQVRVRAGEQIYIFKSIERPFYQPEDTEILQQELQNLKLCRQSTIVQLESVVVSANPYHTGKPEDSHPTFRGFLLEYHPGGTLEDALGTNRVRFGLRKWPIQIARGIEQLHRLSIAHMDLKPSNIVLSINDDAIIIDISGVGVTRAWLAPWMHEVDDPFSLPWDARRRNDIWAYGTLLSMMVQFESNEQNAKLLQEVIEATRTEEPCEQIELCHVIDKLGQYIS